MARPAEPREVATVVAQQRCWALRNHFALNRAGNGLGRWSDALFKGELHPDTRTELEAGAGGELRRIHSLRSSTCLALNVFGPWRSNPKHLALALGGTAALNTLRFEAKQPTGLGGEVPHLDVLLSGAGPPVGIEAKFLELYSPVRSWFPGSYFAHPGLWNGLEACRALAARVADDVETFRWLKVDQLLKHALGLSKLQERFRLVLVWYRVDGKVVEEIETEIGRFARITSEDFGFAAVTYQDLVADLLGQPEPTKGYFSYLADRYQLGPVPRRRLPLIAIGEAPEVNRRAGLTDTVRSLDVADLVEAYHRTTALAPQRQAAGLDFFVGHEGGGAASKLGSEKVVAKGIFNHRQPLVINGEPVDIVDYEVPLRAWRTDSGVGEIDLLGVEGSGRPWLIELKIAPNSETPLKALLQALRYSAILDANRRSISSEATARLGTARFAWPAVIAVAADRPYWARLEATARAGPWLPALKDLSGRLEAELGVEVALLDLGNVEAALVDGAVRLTANLNVSRL